MEKDIRKIYIRSTIHFLLATAQNLNSSLKHDGDIDEQWFAMGMKTLDTAKEYAKKACGEE